MPYKSLKNNIKVLSRGFIVMRRVVVAIILRETKTRFGKNKLGYLWAIIEPACYVGILLIIRSELHSSVPYGENLYLFILTGILVYRIFISISGRALNAISANNALLTYPVVRPIDTVVARVVLEGLTMIIVVAIFFSLLSVLSDKTIIQYPQIFFQGILATLFLGSCIGFLNAILSVIFPVWERLWGLIKFPILFLSGVFYIPNSMPPFVRDILEWNPVLHCVEWLRYGSYLDYDPILDRGYVVWFSLTSLSVALIIERKYRNSMVRV